MKQSHKQTNKNPKQHTKKSHKRMPLQEKISKMLYVFSSQQVVSNQCAMECVGHRCQTAVLTILL